MSFDRIEYAGLTFTDDEIVDGEAFRTLSLLYDALEIGTFFVELYLTDPGVGAALAEFRRNAKLLYYHRDKLRGTYYVESVARTGMYTYEITANDALSLLDQSNHMGGIYTGQTVAQVAAEICNIPYLIQSKLAGIKLYGWLPIASRRSNLAQVLFAVGGVAKVDQNGVLRLETLWNGACSNIPESRVFWGDKVNYASKVTEISVLEHQYIMGAEEIKLFEGAAVDGDLIQFSEPAHSLTAQGFRILEQGANYARVSGGSGTLTGLKYIHTTRDVREPVSEDEVPNVVEVTGATLVSLTNSAAVAQRLAAYYRQTESVEHEVVYDGETPGDVVTMTHPYGGAAFGCISEASISLGRSPVAAEKVALGYAPPVIGDGEILEERVVLTGTGTWTPPEGVESVRAVLIGGAPGGQAGFDGEDGGASRLIVAVDQGQQGGSWSDPPKDPGDGGLGGQKGEGGKIFQTTVDVTPGAAISFSCGAGGPGGEDDGEVGGPGGDTVFGSLSSADGGASDMGYTDPVTGEQYAKPGVDGTPGASGGKGGSGENSGGRGEDVPPNTGGAGANGNKLTGTQGGGELVSQVTQTNGGGGGGGAAKGGNGNAPVSETGKTLNGGDGGDAEEPERAVGYGTGGNGGHGGGGGGSTGGITWSCTPGWASCWIDPSGGKGGKGSRGSDGAPGCIILYYAIIRKSRSAPVKDRAGRMVLDRLGRRIIV